MPDNVEAIALRLREFIQAVDRKAGAGGFQTRVEEMRAVARKDPKSATYEACLGKLTPDELVKFDSMIEKMSSVLGSPFGAIIPA
jgi:hypothetical protein